MIYVSRCPDLTEQSRQWQLASGKLIGYYALEQPREAAWSINCTVCSRDGEEVFAVMILPGVDCVPRHVVLETGS